MKMLLAFCRATERSRFSSSLLSCIAEPQFLRGQRGTKHACLDFGERGIARGRRIVAERRVSTVVRGTQPVQWNVLCCLQYTITYFFRRFDTWIDGRNDTDENMLIGLSVFPDHLEHALLLALARQRYVEVADLEFEQARQQFSIVNVGAMG